jgi:myosin heavy subunit
LNQFGCIIVKYNDDAKEFEHSCRAFDILNVSEEDRWSIWEVIAAILHLGNLPFVEDTKETAALKDEKELNAASELLGVDPKQLKEGFLRPKIEVGVGGEQVVKGMNLEKVAASRDALCKALYHRLFVWVVHKINEVLSHPEKKALFIGVLDISGFEIFTHNSFEQLCINFTNEKLQQFFNHHMFTLEQKEYETEQIEWSFIDFGMDSQDTIDLIEKPPNGILTILDEQTNFRMPPTRLSLVVCTAPTGLTAASGSLDSKPIPSRSSTMPVR